MTAPTHRRARTSPARQAPVVTFGGEVAAGGHRVPVIAPPGVGADVEYVVEPADADAVRSAGADVIMDVAAASEPELVDAVARTGAGIVVDDVGGPGAAYVAAAKRSGTPVVLRLASCAVDTCAVEGESGGVDAVLVDVDHAHGVQRVRQRFGVPVLVRLGCGPEPGEAGAGVGVLAGVAMAAGADALWLSGAVSAADVAQVREAAARLGPLVRPAVPETMAACREVIDDVDAVIATLLEYRVGLAGRIQQLKPIGGYAGRDGAREAAIATAMARRAPSLSRAAIDTIVAAVIEAGLEAAERAGDHEPPVWRG